MMQPFETDTNGAGMPTGRTVIAFGRLLELDRAARAAALAKLSEDDPDLARQLASLLANADRPTIVITGFAATTSTGPAPHPHLVAGSRIGGFELLEQIGSGGMGEVWRARQSNPTREVALKVARLDAHAATRSAAVREPEALAALRHPGIATIHASGIDGGFGWIAMELIDGAQTLVDAARTQPLRTRIALLADVADAIAHAHAAGFIHRDLKPSNILVDAAGRVKVIDFGIALPSAGARIADPVAWCGTPAYLAPEALDHDPSLVDARADIYALGVILYELAFGALPAGLSQRDPIALLRALATVSFAPPADAARETRGDLAAIIAKATARDPKQRYRTVAAMSDDLRALLAHRPVAAAPPNAAARLRLAVRRNPVAAALVIAVFLCLIAATAVSTYYALYARRAAIEAGALATKTGEVYGSFLGIFLPDDIAKPEVRSLSVEEYLRSRVQNLERMAAAAMPLDQLDGKLQIPQTLQYACLSLGLVTEAERCAIARELIESRINDPKGAIAGMRNLDSLYARLVRDPNNQAARSALDTLIPTLLSQYAIVRAEPLSVIAAVDYYGNPTMSAHVAELLVRQEPDSPEVLMAALSRLVIAAHKSTQQGEILNDQHLANLRNCVQILRRLAASSDPMVRRQTRSIASRANMLLSADLPVARNPELSPILIELALIEHELDEFKSRLTRHCVTLHYFQVTPFRLAQAGEWDACTKSLETLDEVVRSKHLTLDHSDIRNFALARAELALHRNADINPSAGRLKALEILGDALSTDVAAEDPYTAYTSFAAAIDRHATLAAELGFREELTRDLERTDRFLRSINNSRAPADLVLQVGERIAILLRATPQPIRE